MSTETNSKNKLRHFLLAGLASLKQSLVRFYPVVIYTAIIFICYCIKIYGGYLDEAEEYVNSILVGCLMAIFIDILCRLVVEEKKLQQAEGRGAFSASSKGILCHLPFVLSLAGGIVFGVLQNYFYFMDCEHIFEMVYVGILVSAAFGILYFSYTKENEDLLFAWYIKSTIFAFAVMAVLYLGLMLCISAINALLVNFEGDIFWYMIMTVNALVWAFLFPNLLCSFIPHRDDKLTVPKAYKAIASYAMLPIYLILICILYLYIIKIIFTRHMPSGAMNWYASFAVLFYIFHWLGLRMSENAWIKKFLRRGWIVLIPIVIVQVIGIYIRFTAYGLTTVRYVSIACLVVGIISLACIALNKSPRVILLASIVVTLIITITPANAIDIPYLNQVCRLKAALNTAGMLDDGVVTPAEKKINKGIASTIHSSWDYLKDNKSFYLHDPVIEGLYSEYEEGKTDEELFGYGYSYMDGKEPTVSTYEYKLERDTSYVDTSGYSKIYQDVISVFGYDLEDRYIEIPKKGYEDILYDTSKVFEGDDIWLKIDAIDFAQKLYDEIQRDEDAFKLEDELHSTYVIKSGKLPQDKLSIKLDDGRVLGFQTIDITYSLEDKCITDVYLYYAYLLDS